MILGRINLSTPTTDTVRPALSDLSDEAYIYAEMAGQWYGLPMGFSRSTNGELFFPWLHTV